jgi:hypothetical protein
MPNELSHEPCWQYCMEWFWNYHDPQKKQQTRPTTMA